MVCMAGGGALDKLINLDDDGTGSKSSKKKKVDIERKKVGGCAGLGWVLGGCGVLGSGDVLSCP